MMQPWEKNGKLVEGDDGRPTECEECPCSQDCPEDCSGCASSYTATLDGGGAGTGCSYAYGVEVTLTYQGLCQWFGVTGWMDELGVHQLNMTIVCANAKWGISAWYRRWEEPPGGGELELVDECFWWLEKDAAACPPGAYAETGGGGGTAVVS